MQTDLRAEADRRLEATMEARGAPDPRPACREMLRDLRETRAEAYHEAVEEYRVELTRRIAEEGADPLECWLAFAASVAERLHPGKTVRVDESGRARGCESPPPWRELLLHLPIEPGAPVLALGIPPEPTEAQTATLDLLVHRRLRRTRGE